MSSEKINIAHISDPHFGTAAEKKIQALAAVLHDLQPNFVLLSGDITQRARQKQFVEARRFCDSLTPLDVIAVPGNHDIPLFNIFARAFRPYHGYLHHFGHPLALNKKKGNLEVIAINTTHPLRHIQGQLGHKGKHFISQFSPNSLMKIVLTHHPLDCPKYVDEKNLLKDSTSALKIFESSKVDLVLSGHIHDPLARLSYVRYPDTRRPFIISLAGTCLSSRTRANAPNSFNFLEICIERHDIDLNIIRYDLSADFTFEPKDYSRFQRQGPDRWIHYKQD